MRLIDADVLIDICKNKYSDIVAGSYPFNVVVYDLVNIIESQPLAYDVKKVLEELEKESDFFGGEPMGSLQKAYYCKGVERSIDIVKMGGADLGYNPYQE